MENRTVVLSATQARELKFDSYARYVRCGLYLGIGLLELAQSANDSRAASDKRLAVIELAMSLGMSDAEARGTDGPFRVKVDK